MKQSLLTLSLTFALVCVVGKAHGEFVTLIVESVPEEQQDNPPQRNQDVLEVKENQVAEVVSHSERDASVEIIKNNIQVAKRGLAIAANRPTLPTHPLIIKGPAKIFLTTYDRPAFCTIKVTPESFPPGKTLTIPAGTGTAEVTLESSSDLKHWEPTEPGTFGDVEENLFFRIRAEGVD